MANEWDRSSKNDFNKAASGEPAKKEEPKPVAKQDKPAPTLHPPGMGPKAQTSAWDRHKVAKSNGKSDVSKAGPSVEKDDPKLSKNFNNRAKKS